MPNGNGRSHPCDRCKQPHEIPDLVHGRWCWPCYMVVFEDGWQRPPVGWFQVCERCGRRNYVVSDRPLCPQCVRVPTRWRETLHVCRTCGGLFRRSSVTKRHCCPDWAVRDARLTQARRKARHTKAEWAALVEAAGSRCYYCGREGAMTVDHLIPISLGGDDGIANIVPACQSCNSRRGNRLSPEEFRAILRPST